jgi:hypothetical protein
MAVSIDPEFLDMMPTEVSWERKTGADQYGNDTYATAITLCVRVEPLTVSLAVTTQQAGAMMASIGQTTTVIADLTTPRIAAGDRLTIIEDDMALVVNVAVVHRDENGPYYQEAQCINNKEA